MRKRRRRLALNSSQDREEEEHLVFGLLYLFALAVIQYYVGIAIAIGALLSLALWGIVQAYWSSPEAEYEAVSAHIRCNSKTRRRQRALRLGYLRANPKGMSVVLVPSQSVTDVRAMVNGHALHQLLNLKCGIVTHKLRDAITFAAAKGSISTKQKLRYLKVNKLANVAKHGRKKKALQLGGNGRNRWTRRFRTERVVRETSLDDAIFSNSSFRYGGLEHSTCCAMDSHDNDGIVEGAFQGQQDGVRIDPGFSQGLQSGTNEKAFQESEGFGRRVECSVGPSGIFNFHYLSALGAAVSEIGEQFRTLAHDYTQLEKDNQACMALPEDPKLICENTCPQAAEGFGRRVECSVDPSSVLNFHCHSALGAAVSEIGEQFRMLAHDYTQLEKDNLACIVLSEDPKLVCENTCPQDDLEDNAAVCRGDLKLAQNGGVADGFLGPHGYGVWCAHFNSAHTRDICSRINDALLVTQLESQSQLDGILLLDPPTEDLVGNTGYEEIVATVLHDDCLWEVDACSPAAGTGITEIVLLTYAGEESSTRAVLELADGSFFLPGDYFSYLSCFAQLALDRVYSIAIQNVSSSARSDTYCNYVTLDFIQTLSQQAVARIIGLATAHIWNHRLGRSLCCTRELVEKSHVRELNHRERFTKSSQRYGRLQGWYADAKAAREDLERQCENLRADHTCLRQEGDEMRGTINDLRQLNGRIMQEVQHLKIMLAGSDQDSEEQGDNETYYTLLNESVSELPPLDFFGALLEHNGTCSAHGSDVDIGEDLDDLPKLLPFIEDDTYESSSSDPKQTKIDRHHEYISFRGNFFENQVTALFEAEKSFSDPPGTSGPSPPAARKRRGGRKHRKRAQAALPYGLAHTSAWPIGLAHSDRAPSAGQFLEKPDFSSLYAAEKSSVGLDRLPSLNEAGDEA